MILITTGSYNALQDFIENETLTIHALFLQQKQYPRYSREWQYLQEKIARRIKDMRYHENRLIQMAQQGRFPESAWR